MSNDPPQRPEGLTGGCMCGAVRYTMGRTGSRYRPFPLQPLPAAIRERLLDRHFRASQCDSHHWRNGGVRRYRGERIQDVTSLLPTLRFAYDNRLRRNARQLLYQYLLLEIGVIECDYSARHERAPASPQPRSLHIGRGWACSMVGVRRRTGPLLKNCSSASESPGEMDRIFVADGPVRTSARGWHRFGARLIEHDMGQDTARANARTMVVYHRRARGPIAAFGNAGARRQIRSGANGARLRKTEPW
jgi:hypothetical protein